MVTFMAATTQKQIAGILHVEGGKGDNDADLKIQTGRTLDQAGAVPYAFLAPILVRYRQRQNAASILK